MWDYPNQTILYVLFFLLLMFPAVLDDSATSPPLPESKKKILDKHHTLAS